MVPSKIQYFSDKQLVRAAQLIKNFHDATAYSTLANSNEIVCHNDLTPCNAVFVDEMPIALTDFDTAAPGTRIRDLGYAVWQWCDLGNIAIPIVKQRRRIKLFLNAYGEIEANQIFPAILNRQDELIAFFKSKAKTEPYWYTAQKWGEQCQQWLIAHQGYLVKYIE